mgnify:CR=1 FL=1
MTSNPYKFSVWIALMYLEHIVYEQEFSICFIYQRDYVISSSILVSMWLAITSTLFTVTAYKIGCFVEVLGATNLSILPVTQALSPSLLQLFH